MTTRIEKFYPWKHPCPKCGQGERTSLLWEPNGTPVSDRYSYCPACDLMWRLPMNERETKEAFENQRALLAIEPERVTRTLDEIVGRAPWTRELTALALGHHDDGPPITDTDRDEGDAELTLKHARMRNLAAEYAMAMIRHSTVWLTMRDAPLHENGALYDTLYKYADEMDRLHKELKHLTREIAEASMR